MVRLQPAQPGCSETESGALMPLNPEFHGGASGLRPCCVQNGQVMLKPGNLEFRDLRFVVPAAELNGKPRAGQGIKRAHFLTAHWAALDSQVFNGGRRKLRDVVRIGCAKVVLGGHMQAHRLCHRRAKPTATGTPLQSPRAMFPCLAVQYPPAIQAAGALYHGAGRRLWRLGWRGTARQGRRIAGYGREPRPVLRRRRRGPW